ncbi:MAG: hypothetical protein PF541_16830 [Prolixibacteraceae bacterium]|jgi:hypothetical protein|nr:hypothetical protein [Prolixibacteraceae bacterium]
MSHLLTFENGMLFYATINKNEIKEIAQNEKLEAFFTLAMGKWTKRMSSSIVFLNISWVDQHI